MPPNEPNAPGAPVETTNTIEAASTNAVSAPAVVATVEPVLALPRPEVEVQRVPEVGARPPRVLALTEAGVPLTRAFARLVQALREAGAEIVPLALPRTEPAPESVPTLTELKRGITTFAKELVRGFHPGEQDTEPWIVSQLKAVGLGGAGGGSGGAGDAVTAVLATTPDIAKSVFPFVDRALPGAIRIGVDTDYHLDPEWKAVELDAIIVAHPGLGVDLPRVREGSARTFIGGPVTGGGELGEKRLGEELPQVAVSFARLDPGDVDPLLFQLSLARPERFSLLFLPSARAGVDELVRARAGGYGLRGKRPKTDAELEAWIRGSSLLVGFPSPAESATAVAAGVPILFVASERALVEGDRFLVQHGAMHSEVPITIAVHVEGLLPGGNYRGKAEEALRELEPSGPAGAAKAVIAAIKAGRPVLPVAPAAGAAVDDDLEDIGEVHAGTPGVGGATAATSVTADLPLAIRRAYLKEIILQLHSNERNLGRAKGGLETWQRRVRLARTSGQDGLADKAVPRVEGLMKVIDQLEREARELQGLRERFASNAPLSAADRAAAARYLQPRTATAIDRGEAPDSAFTQLELQDALAVLKRKLEGK